jgi:hypothetical protein
MHTLIWIGTLALKQDNCLVASASNLLEVQLHTSVVSNPPWLVPPQKLNSWLLATQAKLLWDLNIPQEAATLLYKDNGGCTAMGNAHKPTSCTRHIDIKFFSLCDWVEPNLMLLN